MTLLEYRKSLGQTQAQFAERLGVTTQAYQQWESGTRNPGLDALYRISSKLDVIITIQNNSYEIAQKTSK